jgi:hypothetical protein
MRGDEVAEQAQINPRRWKVRVITEKFARRRMGAVAATIGVVASLLVGAQTASADQSYYCTSCQIVDYVTDDWQGYLTMVYGHYLGSGDRYMEAVANPWGGAAYAYNEVAYHADGSRVGWGTVINTSGHSWITSNAHDDFNGSIWRR